MAIEEKIEIIAKKIYGADGIELQPLAQEQIARYKRQVSSPPKTCPEVMKSLSGGRMFSFENITGNKASP